MSEEIEKKKKTSKSKDSEDPEKKKKKKKPKSDNPSKKKMKAKKEKNGEDSASENEKPKSSKSKKLSAEGSPSDGEDNPSEQSKPKSKKKKKKEATAEDSPTDGEDNPSKQSKPKSKKKKKQSAGSHTRKGPTTELFVARPPGLPIEDAKKYGDVTDIEAGEPVSVMADRSPLEATAEASVIKSRADAKGTIKASTGELILNGVLLTLVIAVAIGGVVLAFAMNYRNSEDPYEPYVNDEPITGDPFEVEASLFSSNITEPYYTSIEDLKEDIEALAKSFVNTIIEEEATTYDYYNFGSDDFQMMEPIVMESIASDGGSPSSSSSGLFKGVDGFETYQQEAGVVKNDLVKSNGAHVFTAIGDHIEVWDLEGNLWKANKIRSIRSGENDISIHALLMNPEGNKLTVIASEFIYEQFDSYEMDSSIYHKYGTETLVIIYDIEGSSLAEISRTYIDGSHLDSYSVGNNVHIVTRMRLNTWTYLKDPLMRYTLEDDYLTFDDDFWLFDDDDDLTFDDHFLTDEEYVVAATQKAEIVIADFVDKVIDLVTEGDEIFLTRLVGFPNLVNNYESITQVTSFDTSKTSDEDGIESHTSKSLVFQPGHTGYVYATDEWIWVSDENFGWGLDDQQEYVQQTMLLGFRLDGGSSKFAAFGTVPGLLLSEFSIDFAKDEDKEYIRIAVTQNQNNPWWQPRPMPRPMQMSEVAEAQDETESRTLNEIIILEIPKAESDSRKINELVKLGSVKVGKKDETITAVRFFDNISYVVTFERTDPFYALDLSDPMDPKILGELEVPGFSQFMHPINEDNSMLLTVGQDADENGSITGFQISIFDSTIPNDPKLVDRLVLSNSEDSWTSSSSSWDERAFRYIQVGELGRLIIPLYTSSYNSVEVTDVFDGFTVFGVDLSRTENLITREIDINHWQDSYNSKGCYCGQSWLPERSFVFDGNLMTLKSSTVVSTDLGSQEIQWEIPLQDNENCCSEYYYTDR